MNTITIIILSIVDGFFAFAEFMRRNETITLAIITAIIMLISTKEAKKWQ